MVKILEGADYLYPESRRVERLTLKIVRWLYRRRLRELIAVVPADAWRISPIHIAIDCAGATRPGQSGNPSQLRNIVAGERLVITIALISRTYSARP
jgi:hypothetical protein